MPMGWRIGIPNCNYFGFIVDVQQYEHPTPAPALESERSYTIISSISLSLSLRNSSTLSAVFPYVFCVFRYLLEVYRADGHVPFESRNVDSRTLRMIVPYHDRSHPSVELRARAEPAEPHAPPQQVVEVALSSSIAPLELHVLLLHALRLRISCHLTTTRAQPSPTALLGTKRSRLRARAQRWCALLSCWCAL